MKAHKLWMYEYKAAHLYCIITENKQNVYLDLDLFPQITLFTFQKNHMVHDITAFKSQSTAWI